MTARPAPATRCVHVPPHACLCVPARLPSCSAPPAQSRERGVDPGRAPRKLSGSLPTLCSQLLFSWRRVFPRNLGAARFCKYSRGNRSGRCSAASRSWVGSRFMCETLGKSYKDSLPSLEFVGLRTAFVFKNVQLFGRLVCKACSRTRCSVYCVLPNTCLPIFVRRHF